MADFQKHLDKLEEIDVGLLAASVDKQDVSAKTVRNDALCSPVACELELQSVARLTGCYYDAEKGYLHAAGFLIDPQGKVKFASYSTGPIGRLTAGDCLKLIRRFKKQSSPD